MSAPPYLPFDPGPHRLAMGLMSLKPAEWIEIDEAYEAQLAEKRRLLAERHDEVFAALPQAAAAARELLDSLAEHLVGHFPERFRLAARHLENLVSGESWDLDAPPCHPLEAAARLVQEDLCLMQADEAGAYRLTAAALCFPSRWRLADKLGKPLLAIHDPVPGYDARLGRPVDRFFSLLKRDKPVWRLNWSLYDDPALFQPSGHGHDRSDVPMRPAEVGEKVYLRVERQTLRRLPASGAVLFGIRIHQHPLSSLAQQPAAAADLASALSALPREMEHYKSLTGRREAIVTYLQGLAEGTP